MQIIRKRQKQTEVDLFAVIQLLWTKKWIIVLSGLATMLISLLTTVFFVKPLYSASVTLYANNSNSANVSTSITTQDITASVKLVDTYAAIIMSDPVLDQVIEQNRLGITSKALMSRIRVSSVNETEVFKVIVEYSSPEIAASIANSIANIAPQKIGDIVDGCSVKIVSTAKTPSNKSYPSNKSAMLLGMGIGLFVSIMTIIIISLLDTRVKSEMDLNEWDYPVLGVIPAFSEAEKTGSYGYGNRKREEA